MTDDRTLGEKCMEGGVLGLVDSLSDDVAGLIDPARVGGWCGAGNLGHLLSGAMCTAVPIPAGKCMTG